MLKTPTTYTYLLTLLRTWGRRLLPSENNQRASAASAVSLSAFFILNRDACATPTPVLSQNVERNGAVRPGDWYGHT